MSMTQSNTSSSLSCVNWITSQASLLELEASAPSQLFSVEFWCSYIETVQDIIDKKPTEIARDTLDWIFRRALNLLPRSYKLWKKYWELLILEERRRSDSQMARLPDALDRALWTLHAFPRVWIVYFEFLIKNPTFQSITLTRRMISDCLEALPITQHLLVWPCIRDVLAAIPNLPVETHSRLLSHWVMLESSERRSYAEFLIETEQWTKAACVYWSLLNETQESSHILDPNSLWLDFVSLCAQHPQEVSNLPWERVLNAQLTSSHDQDKSILSSSAASTGQLWSLWAESYVRRGDFDRARTLYERGMQSVANIQQFTVIYNAYVQMEEELLTMIASRMEATDDDVPIESEQSISDEALEILTSERPVSSLSSSSSIALQLEWAMARAEHLTSRRPVWLNQVLLRQNPNDVKEWLKRAKLMGGKGRAASEVLEEALRAVQSNHAVNGSPVQIVALLLQVYENMAIDQARIFMERICEQNIYRFRSADDLAECWTLWVELELRNEAWDDALSLIRQALAPNPTPKSNTSSQTTTRPWNLTKSLRLWDLRLDLEESLGTVQTTKDAYNRVISLKAATVQHVLNFCTFLTEHKYFEEAFTVYERGLENFAFPHAGAKLLWKEYLNLFLNRYQGTKVERVRDLFQRCLESCPAEECAEFYLHYAQYEEQHGLFKRALSVYRDMCEHVPKVDKLVAYQLFIAKTTKYLGSSATRDIYQDALERLDDDKSVAILCLDFVKMETSMQQIDRARAILTFGAQVADPRRIPEYWKAWNDFEISHGDEGTFRDMLRVKRSVEAAFSTINYNAIGMNETMKTLSDAEAIRMIALQEGVDIEEQHQPKTSVVGFVSSNKRTATAASLEEMEDQVAKLRKSSAEAVRNVNDEHDDEEIDIEGIDAEIEQAAAEAITVREPPLSSDMALYTKAIPEAVFGDLITRDNYKSTASATYR